MSRFTVALVACGLAAGGIAEIRRCIDLWLAYPLIPTSRGLLVPQADRLWMQPLGSHADNIEGRNKMDSCKTWATR
jgi:hypothetical protein